MPRNEWRRTERHKKQTEPNNFLTKQLNWVKFQKNTERLRKIKWETK
jgi:hypothetical protein